MKTILILCLMLFPFLSSAQCKDMFGHVAECPTMDDSMTIYNNCLKVWNFYENSKEYKKVKTTNIITDEDRKGVIKRMIDAREKYKEMLKMHDNYIKTQNLAINTIFHDLPYDDYYKEIDEYRFYQRDFQITIMNWNAPISLYDSRIAPIYLNKYKYYGPDHELDSTSVTIPIYAPVTIKPVALLTEAELITRNKMLMIENKKIKPKDVIVRRSMVKRDSSIVIKDTVPIIQNIVTKKEESYKSVFAVYMTSPYGGGCFIGYMMDNYFHKIKPAEYEQYAVPPFAKVLLADDMELDKMLKIKFGGYYIGIFNP